jgi:uncharacterized membrane protein (UPF0127 family)
MERGIINIGSRTFDVLIAISDKEQARGLMFVEPPAPNMVFVYDRPRVSKFWMSNTKCPLDIVFCHNGKITQVCQGEPYSTKLIGDDLISDLVVELPRGAAADFKLGHSVDLIKPTFDELRQIIAEKYHQFVKY